MTACSHQMEHVGSAGDLTRVELYRCIRCEEFAFSTILPAGMCHVPNALVLHLRRLRREVVARAYEADETAHLLREFFDADDAFD